MQQRLTYITLGVRDMAVMKAFYTQKFGWQPRLDSQDGIVFFQMNGFIFALYERNELAEDAKVSPEGSGFRGITFSYNVNTQNEVDEVMADLEKKGVEITRQPSETSWGGYVGYIADPEGNLWEIAWNPFLDLESLKGWA